MALDRNYLAMHKLDTMYSYETLIGIMKLDTITDDIKAAAARLLMCLYVDRDPQCEIKIPVLTQVWSDIAKSVTPSLPYVEPTRRYVFGLLQQVLTHSPTHSLT